METVIMAGGKGTRISSIASDIPKPMILLCGKPILEYQLECLKLQGFSEIVLIIGHLGRTIKDYFRDGQDFGVKITYIEEGTPLGTAGSLYYLKDVIREDFLLINGDIIFDVDIIRFVNYHREHNAGVTLFTHPNNHPYDSGIIITENNGRITGWLHKEDKRQYYKNRVNAGIHILSHEVFDLFKELRKIDLDRDILKPMISSGRLYAYDSPEYVKDMGTPERYQAVIKDIENNRVKSKNLLNKQKAIFLDRDGTINKYKGFITSPEELELIDGVAEAISIMNEKGYLVIVITNQPVIARGECTLDTLQEIHNKMETLLGEKGAYIDSIFYCPHHPDKGFKGERAEYKKICECRKPKPGMILEAAKRFNVNLSNSYMVGDSISDIEAGKAAGCKVVYLNSEYTNEISGDIIVYANLMNFVTNEIMKEEKRDDHHTNAF